MSRACEVCSKPFEAQRKTARYCSSSCRGKAVEQRRLAKQAPEVVPLKPVSSLARKGLRAQVEADLKAADRLDTPAGQQALLLADRLEHSTLDNGSAVAALSRELDRLVTGLLADQQTEPDALDDLQAQVTQLRSGRHV